MGILKVSVVLIVLLVAYVAAMMIIKKCDFWNGFRQCEEAGVLSY